MILLSSRIFIYVHNTLCNSRKSTKQTVIMVCSLFRMFVTFAKKIKNETQNNMPYYGFG